MFIECNEHIDHVIIVDRRDTITWRIVTALWPVFNENATHEYTTESTQRMHTPANAEYPAFERKWIYVLLAIDCFVTTQTKYSTLMRVGN